MSGYEAPPRFPLGNKEPRIPHGHVIYDRYSNFRARSPSPDSFSRRMLPVYPRDGPSSSRIPAYHRDEFQPSNNYRQNQYRSDWDYYHAPDHYEPPPEAFVRDRAASWSSSVKPVARVDRRSSIGTSTSQYAPPRRDADMLASRMAPARMFEPSDSWKQNHDDHRFIPRQSFSGDKYRPTVDRDSFSHGRADLYRPRYDGSRYSRDPDQHQRRNSGSRYTESPRRSRSRSISSMSRSIVSPTRSHALASRSPSPFRRRDSSRQSSRRRSRSSSSSAFTVASSRPSEPPANEAPPINPNNTSENGPSNDAKAEIAENDLSGDLAMDSVPLTASPIMPPMQCDAAPDREKGAITLESDIRASTIEHPAKENSGQSLVPSEEAVKTPATTVTDISSVEFPSLPSLPLKEPSPPPTSPAARPDPHDAAAPPPEPSEHGQALLSPMDIDVIPDATEIVLKIEATPIEPPTADPTTPADQAAQSPKPTDAPVPAKPSTPLKVVTNSSLSRPESDLPGSPSPVADGLPTAADIPTLSKNDTLRDALRHAVMTRLVNDRQTREEIIAPIINGNHVRVWPTLPEREVSSSEELVAEMQSGAALKSRLDIFAMCKPSLVKRFEDRQATLLEKVERLRSEYIELHEKWLVHCAALDEQNKPSETETVQPTGRTTRRTANLGDAVRSDLEMEQIIASLGNDDATDPNHLSQKNLAVIPEMISVTQAKVDYLFDDTNHLVTDPHEYYACRTGMDDWTLEEKNIFCEKFALNPKQFGIIAEALPNKTQSQCVSYYYLHKKKQIDFRKVIMQYIGNKRRRKRTDKQKGNALLTDIRRHDAEVNRDGSPASAPTGRGHRRKPAAGTPQPSEPSSVGARRQPRRSAVQQLEATPVSTPTPEPETRTRRRRTNNNPLATSSSVDDLAPAPSVPVTATPTPIPSPAPSPVPSPTQSPGPTPSTALEDEVTDLDLQRPAKKAKRSRKVVKSAAIVSDDVIMDDAHASTGTPVARSQSATPYVQLPTLSEEQQKVVLGLLADYMNPAKNFHTMMHPPQSFTPDMYGRPPYPGHPVPPGSVRYAEMPMPRSNRPSEPVWPGAGVMSPVMSPAPGAPPMHFVNVNEPYSTPSSRTSFHANPWVPFQSGSAPPGMTPPLPTPPPSLGAHYPPIPFTPIMPPGSRGMMPVHGAPGPPLVDPRGPNMGSPLPHLRHEPPPSMPPFTPTLPITTPGPSTSLERTESRIYRASGQFVPVNMATPPLPPQNTPLPRGRNPYPIVPPPYNTSYNVPR